MAKIERKSINFKLPKPLADALRAKARELKTTATDLVIQGLHHVLDVAAGTENSVEIRLHQMEEQLRHLATSVEARVESSIETQQQQRITHLEQELKALTNRLALIEAALVQMQRNSNGKQKSTYSSKRQYYPQQSWTLEPLTEEKLAERLLTDTSTLSNNRKTWSQSEFMSWSRSRDPGRWGWRYEEKDGLYHPVR